jgi:hypothetical protein
MYHVLFVKSMEVLEFLFDFEVLEVDLDLSPEDQMHIVSEDFL